MLRTIEIKLRNYKAQKLEIKKKKKNEKDYIRKILEIIFFSCFLKISGAIAHSKEEENLEL